MAKKKTSKKEMCKSAKDVLSVADSLIEWGYDVVNYDDIKANVARCKK